LSTLKLYDAEESAASIQGPQEMIHHTYICQQVQTASHHYYCTSVFILDIIHCLDLQ